MDHRDPRPTHSAQISFLPPGRGHQEHPSVPGCPGVSSCSRRCWWPAAPRARGFARRRLAPLVFGEGMAIQPRKMYFSSRLSRLSLPLARCRWQRALRPGKESVCTAGSRRNSQNSLISVPTAEPCAAAISQPQQLPAAFTLLLPGKGRRPPEPPATLMRGCPAVSPRRLQLLQVV